jgi:hypothetical protein
MGLRCCSGRPAADNSDFERIEIGPVAQRPGAASDIELRRQRYRTSPPAISNFAASGKNFAASGMRLRHATHAALIRAPSAGMDLAR